MSTPPRVPSGKLWWSVGVIGILAIGAGMLLPQFLPANPSPANSGAAKAETTSQSQTPPQGNWTYTPPTWPEPPNYQGMFLRLGLGTVVVLGLCVGSLWFGKRWLRGSPGPITGSLQVRLVETLPLANRCCLHLVHVGKQSVLVGANSSGIQTIVPLPESFSTAFLETQAEPE